MIHFERALMQQLCVRILESRVRRKAANQKWHDRRMHVRQFYLTVRHSAVFAACRTIAALCHSGKGCALKKGSSATA
jgi:hypothetical protein